MRSRLRVGLLLVPALRLLQVDGRSPLGHVGSARTLAASWLLALQTELRLSEGLDLAFSFGAELFTPCERYAVNGRVVQDLGLVRGYAAWCAGMPR